MYVRIQIVSLTVRENTEYNSPKKIILPFCQTRKFSSFRSFIHFRLCELLSPSFSLSLALYHSAFILNFTIHFLKLQVSVFHSQFSIPDFFFISNSFYFYSQFPLLPFPTPRSCCSTSCLPRRGSHTSPRFLWRFQSFPAHTETPTRWGNHTRRFPIRKTSSAVHRAN